MSDLTNRLEKALKLGEMCGVRGKSPTNVYNLLAEAIARIKELEAKQ